MVNVAKTIYPYHKTKSENIAQLWAVLFRAYTYKEAVTALVKHSSYSPYFPTPAELIKLIEAERAKLRPRTPGETFAVNIAGKTYPAALLEDGAPVSSDYTLEDDAVFRYGVEAGL